MAHTDVFEELPLEQWPLLQEKLKALWPLNVGGYYALDTYLQHPPLREAFHFRVYCLHGDVNNGFIAISDKDVHLEKECLINTIDEDTSKLEEALTNTKRIDWNSKHYIVLATSVTLSLIHKLKSRIGFVISRENHLNTFYLDKMSEPYDVKYPPGTYLSAIDPDDITQVNDTWAYKNLTCSNYLSTLASNGLSYGLYSFDKKLLAWIFLNEYNFLRHLYCQPDHRRKGYAEFLVKSLVNDSLKKGKDVYGFVDQGNLEAMKLFVKLGFQLVKDIAFMNVGGSE